MDDNTANLLALALPPVGIADPTVSRAIVLASAILTCVSLLVLVIHWHVLRMRRVCRPDAEAAWRVALTEKLTTLNTQGHPQHTTQRRPQIRRQDPTAVLRRAVAGDRPASRASIDSSSDSEDDPLASSEAYPSNLRWWARDIPDSLPQPLVLSDQDGYIGMESVTNEKNMLSPDEHGALPIGARTTAASSRTSTATAASAVTSGSSSSDRTVRASWSTMARSMGDTTLATPPISVRRASTESTTAGHIDKLESLPPLSPSPVPSITRPHGGGFLSALALHLSIMPAMTRVPWSRSSKVSQTEINERPMSASTERKSMPTVWEFEEQDTSGHWQASPAIGHYEGDGGPQGEHAAIHAEAEDRSSDGDSYGHTASTSGSGLTEIVLGDIMEVAEANRSAGRANEQLGALSGAWEANAVMLRKETV